MLPGTAVTQTGSVVTHEPAAVSHEAGSCVVAAVMHHPSTVAPLGLGFLESTGPLPAPLLWTVITQSVFSSTTVRYREQQPGLQLTGGAGKAGTAAGSAVAEVAVPSAPVLHFDSMVPGTAACCGW
jgi:hypothetical protein